MENSNGEAELGGKGIFFTAVMGDRPYCKITVVVPPTATDEEIEHAADRYRKVADAFREIIQTVNLGVEYEAQPLRIPTGSTEKLDLSRFTESDEEAKDLAEIVERYNIKRGTDF